MSGYSRNVLSEGTVYTSPRGQREHGVVIKPKHLGKLVFGQQHELRGTWKPSSKVWNFMLDGINNLIMAFRGRSGTIVGFRKMALAAVIPHEWAGKWYECARAIYKALVQL